MSQSLTNIGARPAHLPTSGDALSINKAAFQNWQSGFGVLSLRGGKWHERRGGNETTITASPAPGMAPVAVPAIPVVIVGVSSLTAKSYYAGNYNQAEAKAPDCFSIDGVEPDQRATNKQNPNCATCRHNAWGSAVNSPSGRGKACRDFKRIAVVRDLNDEPLMLQLPPTSVPNLQDYLTRLTRLQAGANQVVTVLSFDTSKTAPTVTFEAQAWLSPEQYARAEELRTGPSVQRMLEQEWGGDEEASPAMATTLGPRPSHLNVVPPQEVVQAARQALATGSGTVQPAHSPAATPFPMKVAAATPPAEGPAKEAPAPTPPAPPTPPPVPPAPSMPPPLPAAAAAPPQVVQGAPADMQSAIDALLNIGN